jgi:hypothetical protein
LRKFLERQPDLVCDVHQRWSGPKQVLLPCGAQGILILDRTARGFEVREVRREAGDVKGFFVEGGRIWARIVEERAVVVARTGIAVAYPAEPPSPSAQVPSAPATHTPDGGPAPPREQPASFDDEDPEEEWPLGQVIAVDGLDVQINLGARDGISNRARVGFGLDAARDEHSQSAEGFSPEVVGRVVEVTSSTARVRISVGEMVKVGTPARLTRAPLTGSRSAPERVTGVWEIRGILRPFLNLGAFGGGLLGEGGVGYRTRVFHVGATLVPLGIAGADGADTMATWGGYVYAAFDSSVFSAGLGLGGQAVNDTGQRVDQGSGISLVQLLRLGAVDGLHLMSRTKAVVFHSLTEFSSLEMQGQIAVANDSWLILRGGGGVEGYGYGEVAVRALLRGNGGKDSLFLEISVGGAGLHQSFCPEEPTQPVGGCPSGNVAGPLVGLGAEWRL